ncbi:nuclease [Rhynchospora pubera]|uniref:Nuclease n=1 Tax=Rhynchospora pubera TaxID=906938 RepID=A0AAV8HVU1_9POAL|nr:nuclease [Rhynchospora pubera]
MNDFEAYRIMFVAAMTAYIGYLIVLIHFENYQNQILEIRTEAKIERKEVRDKLMKRLGDVYECRNVIRMGPEAFERLCAILRGTNRLRDNNYSCVEEQVAKFLHVLSQNTRNRLLKFYFGRSLGTISSHFHRVLRALLSLEDRFLLQPTDDCAVPNEIVLRGGRFYPYFEKCVGAIDGTHIRVKVPANEARRYRSRKQFPTQNILVACSFDLKFKYVLAGWEGSAHDSTVLQDALTREDKLKIPHGNQMKRSSKLGIKRKVQDLGTNNTDSKTPGNQMEEGLNRVTNSMSEIARALQVANENFIKSNSRIYSPEEILAELKKLGISGDGMLDAADLLMSDNKKAGLFFACPDELKGRWLQRNGFNI